MNILDDVTVQAAILNKAEQGIKDGAAKLAEWTERFVAAQEMQAEAMRSVAKSYARVATAAEAIANLAKKEGA